MRGILGGFLFTGDDVFKSIKVLSGGEKSRVALAKTLLSDANFLLLDEPTNHLDIQSIQILSGALQAYEGTYVVVSHDRFFLREVANKIWYIEDQHIREFPGTYEEFNYHLDQQKELAKSTEKSAQKANEKQQKEQASKGKSAKNDFHKEKELRRKETKLKSAINRIETEIIELEEKKDALLSKMADPEMATQFDKLQELQKELNVIEAKLGPAQTKWEELLEALEEVQS